MKHWTQASTSDFAYNISLDFFTQVDDRIQECGLSRKEFSEKLRITPSAVSQTLNNPPENPHVETLVSYAQQLGAKVAIILYDDNDPDNDKGPIYSGVFGKAWHALGCPRDLSMFNEGGLTWNPPGLITPLFSRANRLINDDPDAVTKQQPEVQMHKDVKNVTGGLRVQRATA